MLLATGLLVALTSAPRGLPVPPDPTAPSTATAREDVAAQVERIARHYHDHGMLNGALLVRVGGETLYEGTFGSVEPTGGRAIDEETLFYLGSVSKQFTAMAVLMLVEEGRLALDDRLGDHLEGLAFASEATVRQLLTHSAGVPDYLNELDRGRAGLTNEDVHRILAAHGRLNFPPGARVSYSNGGYVLLASIVAAAAGTDFAAFLAERVFEPLGMLHTLVRDEHHRLPANHATGYDLTGAVDDYAYFTAGPGGIYSNLRDLARWDEGLRRGALVAPELQSLAFTPATLADGTPTPYGFGWQVMRRGGTTRVFHAGGNAGCGAWIQRELESEITIVMLTNCQRAVSLGTMMAVDALLHGRPLDPLPRIEAGPYLAFIERTQGLDRALERHRQILETRDASFDMGEEQLNTLGYDHLRRGNPEVAVALFQRNARTFPRSANVHDSLGEGLEASGDRAGALAAYRRCLELEPENAHAQQRVRALREAG